MSVEVTAVGYALTALATAAITLALRLLGRPILPWSAAVLLVGAASAVAAGTSIGNWGRGVGEVNLVPLAGVVDSLRHLGSDTGLVNLAGNVAVFAPIGFAVALLLPRPRGIAVAVVAGALYSVSIETTQWLGARTADIDDVLLNTVGAAAGAVLARPVLARPVGAVATSDSPTGT